MSESIYTSERERRVTAHLLRTILGSGHPTVQLLVRVACPSFQDVKAVTNLCERLEGASLAVYADARARETKGAA